MPFSTYYTKTHEWIEVESSAAGKSVAKMGITNYAQEQLGEVVFVELPDEGKTFSKRGTIVTLESVKAVGEVYCPMDSAKITSVNTALADTPGLVNSAAEGEGWLVRFEYDGEGQPADTLTADEYAKLD